MSLLQWPESDGYPRDYLLSRLRVRRRDLLSASAAQIAGPTSEEGGWTAFRRECAWVFRQMEVAWRRDFAPLLVTWEIPVLLRAVRFIRQGDRSMLEALFRHSLLSRQWQTELGRCRDGAEAAAAVTAALSEESPALGGVEAIYRREGGRRFEQELVERFLGAPCRGRPLAVVGAYFRAVIDSRNLLRLAKHQRWNLEAPALLDGGELTVEELDALWRQRDLAAVMRRAAAWAGAVEPKAWGSLSVLLERGMLRRARLWGSDPLQAGVVLDYLCRCRLRARNLNLLKNAGEAGREEWAM